MVEKNMNIILMSIKRKNVHFLITAKMDFAHTSIQTILLKLITTIIGRLLSLIPHKEKMRKTFKYILNRIQISILFILLRRSTFQNPTKYRSNKIITKIFISIINITQGTCYIIIINEIPN